MVTPENHIWLKSDKGDKCQFDVAQHIIHISIGVAGGGRQGAMPLPHEFTLSKNLCCKIEQFQCIIASKA